MTEAKRKEVLAVADYIIENDCTFKEASKKFEITENKVAYYVYRNLRDIDEDKFKVIREGIKRHKIQKVHINKWNLTSNCTPRESQFCVVRFANGEIEFASYNALFGNFYSLKNLAQELYPKYWRNADYLLNRYKKNR